MSSYLWYKKIFDNNFIESEHPRDDSGKFTQKDTPAPVSPEQHKKDSDKIKSVQNYLKEQGIKNKAAKATQYGSLYIKAYLPTKKVLNGLTYLLETIKAIKISI